MKLLRVFALTLCFAILLAGSVPAELQKPYTDEAVGYKIALPNRWTAQPISPPTDTDALGIDSFWSDLFKDDTLKTLLVYKGPEFDEGEWPPQFYLFSIDAKSLMAKEENKGKQEEEAVLEFCKQYGKGGRYGTPKECKAYKVKCSKTKVTRMRLGRAVPGDEKVAWYFIAKNDNGWFLLTYEYWGSYKQVEKQVMESAESFGYVKRSDKKKGKYADDPRIDLPPGWEIYESKNYLIQHNEKDINKVKKYANLIEQLHAHHVKLLPPKPEVEKYRPKCTWDRKFLVKYFCDRKTFEGYAKDSGAYGAAAWYSPGQGEIAFYDTGWGKEALCILYHECTHQYLHDFVGGPRVDFHIWINEGLAEYFFAAGMEESGKVKVGAVHKDAENSVKQALRGGGSIQVADLIKMSQREYYDIGRLAYDHGWALAHYLNTSSKKEYSQVVPTYFYSLQQIVFPLLQRLSDLGESIYLSFEEGKKKNPIEEIFGGDEEEDGDLTPEEREEAREKRREKREEIARLKEQLEEAPDQAAKKAFEGIDLQQLQKDFEAAYK